MNNSSDIDLFYKYYQQQRKKLGFDKFDEQRTILGSALSRRPNLSPEVDGEYLIGLIPIKPSIKEDILDALEERCVNLMTSQAASGKMFCKFPIPAIIPGLPYIDPRKAIGPLSERLSKRKNLLVIPKETEEAYFIEIYWQ